MVWCLGWLLVMVAAAQLGILDILAFWSGIFLVASGLRHPPLLMGGCMAGPCEVLLR